MSFRTSANHPWHTQGSTVHSLQFVALSVVTVFLLPLKIQNQNRQVVILDTCPSPPLPPLTPRGQPLTPVGPHCDPRDKDNQTFCIWRSSSHPQGLHGQGLPWRHKKRRGLLLCVWKGPSGICASAEPTFIPAKRLKCWTAPHAQLNPAQHWPVLPCLAFLRTPASQKALLGSCPGHSPTMFAVGSCLPEQVAVACKGRSSEYWNKMHISNTEFGVMINHW